MPVLLIAGLTVLAVGVALFFLWIGAIWMIIKAALPLGLMAGGLVAAYLGWEELRDRRSPHMDFSSPDEANRYKSEARAYQAEINVMRGGGRQNGGPEIIETSAEKAEAEEKKAD